MSRGIPSYRKHKASGQAVVTLNGVDHYLGRYNSVESKAEYDRIIGEWIALGRHLPAGPRGTGGPVGWLIKELISGYFAHCVATKSAGEVRQIKYALRPVRELYGDTKATDFGPAAYKACRQRMLDAGLALATIRNRLGYVRQMVAWGVENEKLDGSALHRLQAVAGLRANQPGIKPPRKVLPVADGDIDSILPLLSPTVRTMVELQRLTGMRPGEVVIMSTSRIDRTVDPWIYRPIKHKTAYRGRDRVVPLGPRAQELLGPWLRANPDRPLFSPRESRAHYDANRPHGEGSTDRLRERWRRHWQKAHPRRAVPRERDGFSTNTYSNAVAEACRRAGVPPFRPHRIRHTYATKVRKEFGLEAAQVLLGHTQADVTQIYAERDLTKAVEVARRIG
jgi:integrase